METASHAVGLELRQTGWHCNAIKAVAGLEDFERNGLLRKLTEWQAHHRIRLPTGV
jgi:hypothetical protein